MSFAQRILKRGYVTAAAERGKKWAGVNAMRDVLKTKPSILGLGSGSTIVYAIKHLAASPLAKSVICIPTSFQTRQLILGHQLQLGSIEQYPRIEVTIDGADEVDSKLNAIKGGGGCLFQERMVAQASDRFVLVADARKQSYQLGTQWKRGVPVEVVPMALTTITYQLKHLFPSANVQLRMATPTDKAGPVVTDNGNLLLDCDFGPIEDPDLLYKQIKCMTGVLDVGLFCHMADTVYYGSLDSEDGQVVRI
ncbi:ribose-5-phosphate isomerase [Choanephora cucurbitarum]|nr:ribose-5-phosphate isomerase [Choanephora cucurbitarum]